MKIAELNPFIRYCRAHKTAFDMKKEDSVCYDCRVFFLDNITGSISINGEKRELAGKTVIYLPPETVYRFHIHFKEHARVIIADFDMTQQNAHLRSSLGTATRQTFQKELVPAYTLPEELSTYMVRNVPQAEHLLIQCADNFLQRNPFYREVSSALLKLCLLELIHQSSQNTQSRLCEDVLSYVHENYATTTLSNKEIASHFGYHPDHLSNLIRQETGRSLHQYIIYYRLQIAKNYLLTTQLGISEIAWRCGFCSSAYFIKVFRENIGMTPKAYRKTKIHTEI